MTALALVAYCGGGILQTHATVAGRAHDLTFWLGHRGPPSNAFGLFWDTGFVYIDFDASSRRSTRVTTSGCVASSTRKGSEAKAPIAPPAHAR